MPRYIIAHWRGEQSLPWSLLVNGILGYLFITFALIAVGALSDPVKHASFALPPFLLFLGWATTGIVRSALKKLSSCESSKLEKVAGVLALSFVAAVAMATARDVYLLYSSQVG